MRKFAPLLFVVVAACNHERHNDNAFNWSRELAAGGTLRVRNLNGTVSVVAAKPGAPAKVHATTKWRKGNPERDLKFIATSEGNDATICAIWGDGTCTATQYTNRRSNGLWRLIFKRGTDASVDFTVEVPAGTRVDVSTVNGELAVQAQAPVLAKTVNGDIHVATAVGPVAATTTNGDVDIRMTTVNGAGDIRAESTNGDVSAYVPQNVDGNANVHTVNGELSSWFPLTYAGVSKRTMEGVLGAGSRTVRVHTTNGSATLGALDALGQILAKP
jgi:hypothetical protein